MNVNIGRGKWWWWSLDSWPPSSPHHHHPCLVLAMNVELNLTTETCMTSIGKNVSKQSPLLVIMGRRSLPHVMRMGCSCVTVHTTNVPRTKDLPQWMLCKSTWEISRPYGLVQRKRQVQEVKPTNIPYMVIILHNQGYLQSVSTDITTTLTAPASILQVTMDNTDRVGQRSLAQSHVVDHIHFLGTLLHIWPGHEIPVTHASRR